MSPWMRFRFFLANVPWILRHPVYAYGWYFRGWYQVKLPPFPPEPSDLPIEKVLPMRRRAQSSKESETP